MLLTRELIPAAAALYDEYQGAVFALTSLFRVGIGPAECSGVLQFLWSSKVNGCAAVGTTFAVDVPQDSNGGGPRCARRTRCILATGFCTCKQQKSAPTKERHQGTAR